MAWFDLDPEQLRTYRPEVAEPDDFDDFWRRSIDETRAHDLAVTRERVDNRQHLVDAFDVSFAGWGGQLVRAWLLHARGAKGPLPTIVSFQGYSGSRGYPFVNHWVAAGFANLVVDARGQAWSTASRWPHTPDADPHAGSEGAPGHMTRGIASPDTYYYRRLYLDSLRAVEAVRALEVVDPTRVLVQGGSQGGGLSIATAGLAAMAGVSLAGALVDVPFLCHFARAIGLTDADPYHELSCWARSHPHQLDEMLTTLSYFDGVNFARRAEVPALFSVGLMDQVCPPSTVFAAYNLWSDHHEETPATDIRVYPHAGHDGGRENQVWEQLGWLQRLLG